MRSLIKLALIIVIVIVGYNYFFGTSNEKEESQEIVEKVKDLGKSIGGLLKSERDKFQEGKYDELFNNISNTFEKIKTKIESTDIQSREALDKLEQEKSNLEEKWKNLDPEDSTSDGNREFLQEMEELLRKTEGLVKDVEEN